MSKALNTLTNDSLLVRALSRWDNEGGRTDTDWGKWPALVEEEKHTLQGQGTAVITHPDNLSTED